MTMRILNAYAGIGGNRKLWNGNIHVTAVEYNPDIAKLYQEFYSDDTVIVGDAHQYLLEHYKEYDFIWASPPRPTHSDIRRCGVHKGQYEALYPDMTLYQEIILLQHFATGYWCIENVKPYYEPLIKPSKILQRHLFWSNLDIKSYNKIDKRKHAEISGDKEVYGFNLNDKQINDKRKILRNLVNPELGLHIFNCIPQIKETLKLNQETLF